MSDKGSNGSQEEREDSEQKPYEGEIESDGGITTLEVIFEIFTSPRRRFVLYYLRDHEVATVEELARQIVAWEAGGSDDEIATDRSEDVASQLVHTHLPKLTDVTFIEYDPRSQTVRYTEPPALLDTILKLLAELERESSE